MRRSDIVHEVLLLLNQYALIEVRESVNLDYRLDALGMDSLKLVELIYELEQKLGVIVDEADMAELSTVTDLIEMFVKALNSEDTEPKIRTDNGRILSEHTNKVQA